MTSFLRIFSILVLLFAQTTHAMPCDTGYMCKSKSGKYRIELTRCRYTNRLELLSVQMDHKDVKEATLGPAYDGRSVGGNVLAFEIDLPTTDDAVRILMVEISGKDSSGRITEQHAESEPARMSVVHEEPISCEIEE
jgi:hypothetical protein